MDVPQYWSYTEPTRIDTVSARLDMLRLWINDLSGVVVAKDDDAAKAERDRIIAEQNANSKLLFESLKRAQEEAERQSKGK